MTASVLSEVGTPLTEQTMTFGGSASHISWDEIFLYICLVETNNTTNHRQVLALTLGLVNTRLHRSRNTRH